MQNWLAHFEWDDNKAALNYEKHGVLFEDAVLTFFDPDFVRIFDSKHSASELRYAGIRLHPARRMLTTVYTERGDNFRIISSRKANKKERQTYEDLKR